MKMPQISPEAAGNTVLGISSVAALAGVADTVAFQYFGTEIGIRGALPEPFDLPDHGMSMGIAACLASHYMLRRRRLLRSSPEYDRMLSANVTQVERHSLISGMRATMGRAALAAIALGSSYAIAEEAVSEIAHEIHARNQQELPPEERGELPLGRADVLDVVYGMAAASGVALARRRSHEEFLVTGSTEY